MVQHINNAIVYFISAEPLSFSVKQIMPKQMGMNIRNAMYRAEKRDRKKEREESGTQVSPLR